MTSIMLDWSDALALGLAACLCDRRCSGKHRLVEAVVITTVMLFVGSTPRRP